MKILFWVVAVALTLSPICCILTISPGWVEEDVWVPKTATVVESAPWGSEERGTSLLKEDYQVLFENQPMSVVCDTDGVDYYTDSKGRRFHSHASFQLLSNGMKACKVELSADHQKVRILYGRQWVATGCMSVMIFVTLFALKSLITE